MGRLERKLNLDLIFKVQAGTVHQPKPLKKVKPPRQASTYRGMRRNTAFRGPKKDRWTWQNTEVRYEPRQIKPPVEKKLPNGVIILVQRKQPKTYRKPKGLRERTRLARQQDALLAKTLPLAA